MAPSSSVAAAREWIDEVNTQYERVHRDFEEQFWGTKMALSDAKFSTQALTRTKAAMEEFLADAAKLQRARELLAQAEAAVKDPKKEKGEEETLSEDDVATLRIFERTFGCYIMDSEEAKTLRGEATALEGELEAARNSMRLGATIGGDFIELSSVGLRSRMRVDKEEAVRRACWEGLRSIGPFLLARGLVDLVKSRNRMAKRLGYVDFYDYKVTQAEGFGKAALFEILDTLEAGTRPLLEAARKRLEADKGAAALEPWNTSFATAGDVTAKLDPYFPFETSVLQWGRSFAALGISYNGASMNLDLLDRKGKYSNGFCHWPQPAWRRRGGAWQPTATNFTSLADPAAVGSGLTGLTTLMHEAGHAAHFANITMPSPLFSQERAPTSVAYAELQSMFLDSLVEDAAWRRRYARDRDGQPLPWELIVEDVKARHPYEVLKLRSMLAVPYFEKALYEMPEDALNADAIAALADRIEREVQGGLAARPLLSVPHILSDEASCYYHGYVLAEMAVHQTRAFFLKRDGRIVDNPAIGPTLREAYWRPGNSVSFLKLVGSLTGAPLTGDAWVATLKQDVEALLAEEKRAYDDAGEAEAEAGAGAEEPGSPKKRPRTEVDLNMRITIVDGDDVIADTDKDGGFLAVCAKFEKFVKERVAVKKAK